jgi:hypothetical protein
VSAISGAFLFQEQQFSRLDSVCRAQSVQVYVAGQEPSIESCRDQGRDTQIAAMVLADRLTVVTHNVKESGRVDKLKVEDWAGVK